MECFSLELEATEVFYGKNQSCRACRETHRTGGNYANYDAIHIYPHPLGEALGRERTSTSALWAGRPPVPAAALLGWDVEKGSSTPLAPTAARGGGGPE